MRAVQTLTIVALLSTPSLAAPASSAQVTGQVDVLVPDPSGGSDYVAKLDVHRSWGPPGNDVHVVSRRREWVRIDKTENGRSSLSYLNLGTGVWVLLDRDPLGGYRSLQVTPVRAKGPVYELRKTGAHETVLGETCTIWEGVLNAGRPGLDIRRFGCVTADGIELKRHTAGSSGVDLGNAQVVELQRRSVDKAYAEPPPDLFDLRGWNDPAPARAVTPPDDFEVLLTKEIEQGQVTVRRRFPWMYEDINDHGRRIVSSRIDGSASLALSFGATGAPYSMSFRRNFKVGDLAGPKAMDQPSEVILGETCTWFDLMPGASDAGRTECRTRDGIPLKIVITGWGGNGSTYLAHKVRRRPLDEAQVLPPLDTVDPHLWGIWN